MRYSHRYRVKAPQAAVADFHRRPLALAGITPPPIVVRLRRAPRALVQGADVEFTIWLGPLPVRWLARIEESSPTGFVDRQIDGPFRRWRHRHQFVPVDDATTEVVDEVEAALSCHPLWGPVGLAMWLGLPLVFAYRQRRTRDLLGRELATAEALPCTPRQGDGRADRMRRPPRQGASGE